MLPKPIHFSKQSQRAPLIAAALKKVDHDIIVVEEAFTPHIQSLLKKELKTTHPYSASLKRSLNVIKIFNSGVMIFSKYPLKTLSWHHFKNCSGADCFASKGVILTEMTHPSGKKLQLAATHMQASLNPKAISARKKQLLHIKSIMDSFIKPGIPQVLAGDLNINAHIGNEYLDAHAELGTQVSQLEGEINITSGFSVPCYNVASDNKKKWVDHIWIKNTDNKQFLKRLKITPFYANINSSEKCSLSDHFAIEGTVQL